MTIPFGGFPMQESVNPSHQAMMLKSMVEESGLDLYRLLENIFIYFYGDGKEHGIQTVFDDSKIRTELKVGAGAANRLDFASNKMEELVGAYNTILRDWLPHLPKKDRGMPPIERPAGPIPAWFMQYMKEDAWKHLARYKGVKEKRERDEAGS